eukprot:2446176-Pyramimonas_sp.AAC.1
MVGSFAKLIVMLRGSGRYRPRPPPPTGNVTIVLDFQTARGGSKKAPREHSCSGTQEGPLGATVRRRS